VDLLHSQFFMKSNRSNKSFGLLLAAFLLFKLSFHTIHFFTCHLSDTHVESSDSKSQIHKVNSTCDLCAKLLSQTPYLWISSIIILVAVFLLIFIDSSIDDFKRRTKTNNLLRAPPQPIL